MDRLTLSRVPATASTIFSLLAMGFASIAWASDGAIEISQTIAISGGVNGSLAGDPPGFPIVISQSGHYVLTGNLSIPSGSAGIVIAAVQVDLDLNGFEIKGTRPCLPNLPTCTPLLGPIGIFSDRILTVVRNGNVLSTEGHGIVLVGDFSEVDRVVVAGAGGVGVTLGRGGRVSDSRTWNNAQSGIVLNEGGLAVNDRVHANGQYGILTGGIGTLNSLVIDNIAEINTPNGIAANGGSTNLLVSRNVLTSNGPILGGRSTLDNLCDGFFC